MDNCINIFGSSNKLPDEIRKQGLANEVHTKDSTTNAKGINKKIIEWL